METQTLEDAAHRQPRSSINVGCQVLGEFLDDALTGSNELTSSARPLERSPLAPSETCQTAEGTKPPKALWLEVIRRHTAQQVGSQLLKVVEGGESRERSVIIYSGRNGQSRVEGEELDVSSDDYLVVHHQSGVGKLITYLLWREIEYITFHQ